MKDGNKDSQNIQHDISKQDRKERVGEELRLRLVRDNLQVTITVPASIEESRLIVGQCRNITKITVRRSYPMRLAPVCSFSYVHYYCLDIIIYRVIEASMGIARLASAPSISKPTRANSQAVNVL